MRDAVCCVDHLHCCPQGTTCDLAHSKCTLTPRWSWPVTRFLTDLQKAPEVQCDALHKCPTGHTCCRKSSSDWGCCPLEEAVCCSDHIHCCPKGFTCDLAEGTCLKGTDSIPWLAKSSASITAVVAASAGSVVPCDPHTACPDGQTCCRLPTGAWGCCPLPQAVCCPDHLHCCPTGFRCGQAGSCTQDGRSIPWLEKRPAIVRSDSSSRDVRCDDQVSCPDGHTCCRLASGAWGCCPLPQAVCCPDHLHCCPTGFRCGQGGTCTKDHESIPWLEKRPAIVRSDSSSRDVRCDDQVSCPDGDTCCRLASGDWGCCPFPQAECCPDHVHCCPTGFRCGSAGTCEMNQNIVIPWLEKRPAVLSVASSRRDVRCDDKMQCSDGQTCCRTKAGGWACCPLPQAICCSDHLHCCPSGHTCDVQNGTCVPRSAPALRLPMTAARANLVKCSERKYCLDGQTCCPSISVHFFCCNFSQGVCCEDRQHCCAPGYTCNLKAQRCDPPPLFAAEGVQLSASLNPSGAVTSSRDVPCDAQHYCHDGQTCCLTSSGGWACCPYDKGSCCSDRRHCCPSGFRCSRTGLDCQRKGPLRWDASSRSTQALPLL
ncbi:progranulin [Sphaerodactylus townsendi]|nr:progranulin [Sphaerodactylus townsendi]